MTIRVVSRREHVAIVGSRDYPDLDEVKQYVAALAEKHPDARVVSGGAKGVDITAEDCAVELGLRVYSFRPQQRPDGLFEIVLVERFDGDEDRSAPCVGPTWRTYGQAAYARNRKIVQHSTQLQAFTTGSPGTANTIELAAAYGVPSKVVTFPRENPAKGVVT